MSDRLPLFPLGTVLFPGLVLPLHIFEERYRALIRHLVGEDGETAPFGAIAIRRGWESGTGDDVSLHDIGCTAEIRQLTEHPDGRYDIVSVGRRRFRTIAVHTDEEPFLTADVEWLPEPEDDSDAEPLVPGLLDLFQRYLELIRTDGSHGGEQMPDDPTVLSYLIAATAVLPVDDRQPLLAAVTTRERLLAERRLLGREMAILRQVRALPMPLGDLAVTPSPN